MKYYCFEIPDGLNISKRDNVLATLNRLFNQPNFIGAAILDVEVDDHQKSCAPYILLKYQESSGFDPTTQFQAWDLNLDTVT